MQPDGADYISPSKSTEPAIFYSFAITATTKDHPACVPVFPAGVPVPGITHVRAPVSAVPLLSPVLAV